MQENPIEFEKKVEALGSFSIRQFHIDTDIAIIHPWVNSEHARFWMLGNTSHSEVRAEYLKILSTRHTEVFVGCFENKPVFLVEVYDPRHEEIGSYIDAEPGDCGMHVLVGPADKHIAGFTSGVFMTIMSFLFEARNAKRVFVEPDVNNVKIHRLNTRFGFSVLRDRIELTGKIAQLEMCLKDDFERACKTLAL